jgi:tRNA(Ile2) C34 agmatinyltransferase TiaS
MSQACLSPFSTGIYVGIDDTDVLDARGTNQLARALVAAIRDQYRCLRILRHQLLDDPRVPYTSKNGSASLVLEPLAEANIDRLITRLAELMRADFIPGSDPGLCVATTVPAAVQAFGARCKCELIKQQEARTLAAAHNIPLIGLGGTEDGVIGALAAIGLAASDNDGRVIHLKDWPDDLEGVQPIEQITERGVRVCELSNKQPITEGSIDLGKKLRPNWRDGGAVLFVERTENEAWQAVRLP